MGHGRAELIKTGSSRRGRAAAAVGEVWEQIGSPDTGLVVMFAPATWDQAELQRAWTEALPPHTRLLGGSSIRINIPFLTMRENVGPTGFCDGLTALSIAGSAVRAAVEVTPDVVREGAKDAVVQSLQRLAEQLSLDLSSDDADHAFAIFLCDGPSGRADAILEALWLAAPRLQIVGGGTGGTLDLVRGKVSAGTVHDRTGCYLQGAVLALVDSRIPFATRMTTSYDATDVAFEVTGARDKTIYELNGKPAAQEYARALDVALWKLGSERLPNSRLFLRNPLGLVIDGQPYLRGVSFRRGNALEVVVGDVQPGQQLRLMKPGDIVAETRTAMQALQRELGGVEGALLFTCAYRSLEADILDVSSRLFQELQIGPIAGLLSYGEYFQGLAVEQTLSLVGFGTDPGGGVTRE